MKRAAVLGAGDNLIGGVYFEVPAGIADWGSLYYSDPKLSDDIGYFLEPVP